MPLQKLNPSSLSSSCVSILLSPHHQFKIVITFLVTISFSFINIYVYISLKQNNSEYVTEELRKKIEIK